MAEGHGREKLLTSQNREDRRGQEQDIVFKGTSLKTCFFKPDPPQSFHHLPMTPSNYEPINR
jgi:hypothetical protein